MDLSSPLGRVEAILARPAYIVPTAQVDAAHREVLDRLAAWMARPDFDGDLAMALVRRWRDEGRLDEERMWSALAVICTHPSVRRYRDAAKCIALQEGAALARGGDGLDAALASVDRHRGVLAWSMGRPEVALDCFLRALERERTAENLGNVLAALAATGRVEEARALWDRARQVFPAALVDALAARIRVDDDLAPLRA